MSRLEEAFLSRVSGWRLAAWSLVLGAGGLAPLLLYIAFGPADGNPIGLGLLALAAVSVAVPGFVVGVTVAVVRTVLGRRRV